MTGSSQIFVLHAAPKHETSAHKQFCSFSFGSGCFGSSSGLINGPIVQKIRYFMAGSGSFEPLWHQLGIEGHTLHAREYQILCQTVKQPRRSSLTSDVNFVTSITYIPRSIWPTKSTLQISQQAVLPTPPVTRPCDARYDTHGFLGSLKAHFTIKFILQK